MADKCKDSISNPSIAVAVVQQPNDIIFDLNRIFKLELGLKRQLLGNPFVNATIQFQENFDCVELLK